MCFLLCVFVLLLPGGFVGVCICFSKYFAFGCNLDVVEGLGGVRVGVFGGF